ncbi:MAG: WecB/TagA/CpsF family glycosyltransferase, partial [Planctomycetota bacterium]
RWVQRLGLEWAHRLVQEPRRLARRYLVDGIPFAVVLLCSSLLKRVAVPKARLSRPPEARAIPEARDGTPDGEKENGPHDAGVSGGGA